jgi:HlyD family secretion protein
MDRPIQQKKWTRGKLAIYGVVVVAGLALITLTLASSRRTRLSIDPNRLTISTVKLAPFQEYIPITGTVQPNNTVYLDLEEGGNVEKIYVESGKPITKGTLILSLANTTAQKENIDAETRLIDNLNQLRNSKINLTTSNLMLKDELLDLDYKIRDLEKTFARYEQLIKGPNPTLALSREQYENTRDQLAYMKNKRTLLQERIRKETELQEQQSSQIDSSIERVNRNLELLSKIVQSLEVRAPIDGQLSTLNAEVGQGFQRGQRVGQIDQLDSFKVQADIDQYYISTVARDQTGTFEFNGRTYELKVTKVYPEVTKDTFRVDLAFAAAIPEGIKRGQTLQIDLRLSESKRTYVVDKGGFYRYTNGRWAYLVASDGASAHRTNIVLGRQNPQSVEVLQGLKAGDSIITSNYDSFNDVDVLTFSQPLNRQ